MAPDTLGFLEYVRGLPEQLAAAHEQAGMVLDRSALPRPEEVDNIVVLGMGGSGIAGDVLRATASALPVPVVVLKQIRTPAFVGPRTLAFALSYSGNTEETLSMASGALDAGARLVAVTAGGELAALAESRGGVHVACDPNLGMPRAAIGALVAPLFVAVFRAGLLNQGHALLVEAQAQLKRRRDQCAPTVEGAANPARELARRIGRSIPLVYGGGALGAVAAYRWKCDINENAKAPAFHASYPELDHNEICGWGQHGDVTRQLLTLVSLRHGFEHARLSERIDRTTELIEEAVQQVIEVTAEGEGRLAELLDLMYLGDWVSCYLALDNDVDPGPIDAITQLKAAMGPAAE
ncbi:MAG TPA: bifunctional phosphoglucose/phosphomannose isomerase [Acidimicrobiia bacterium]|nr:bifunctional phosphoglucose/phosphomannose isomerase [Acidimicrobiia bacterium]